MYGMTEFQYTNVRMARMARLEKTDWLDFALGTGGEGARGAEGADAGAGLGVTRGSFYWHFEDLVAFKRDLIGHWTDRTTGNCCSPWCARGRRRHS
jgi:hypothetical protein